MKKSEILKEIIASRRSVYPKDYTGEVIEQHILDEILSSAQFAPNHKNTKPWRFKVFKGEEKQKLAKEIQRVYKETTAEGLFLEKKFQDFGDKINKSDVIISISVNYSGLLPEWEEVAAVAMAVQNMYLTGTVLGVGGYWSSHPVVHHLNSFLQLQENQRCIGLFYLGKV